VRRWAPNITTGVTAIQVTITRSSKKAMVRVAHPSMRSKPTISIQPVSTSRAMAAGLVPRGACPGKVSEKTSSARMT
jgi:hypothetical protein